MKIDKKTMQICFEFSIWKLAIGIDFVRIGSKTKYEK